MPCEKIGVFHVRLNNEQVIDRLDSLLKSEKRKLYSREPEPMSVDEFNKIIDQAEDDSKNGRLTDATDLKNDIQSWS